LLDAADKELRLLELRMLGEKIYDIDDEEDDDDFK